MSTSEQPSDLGPAAGSRSGYTWRLLSGGVAGTARLTAMTGLVLLVLLAAEGLTILGIRPLFGMHVVVGLLLIPPVALKLLSTGYRFTRYYTGNPSYRAAGPPQPLLRTIAPILVLCTIGIFVSGIVLLLLGPQGREPWRTLHVLSFFIWFWLMTIHMLWYLNRAPRLAWEDISPGSVRGMLAGAMTRRSLVIGSVLLGLALALALLPWDSSWVQWLSTIGSDR